MREAFSGRRRFEEFQTALDAPRAVLTTRLKRLCSEACSSGPVSALASRSEYRLTDKGRCVLDVFRPMWRWGSACCRRDNVCRWVEGRPTFRRRPVVVDEQTGERVDVVTCGWQGPQDRDKFASCEVVSFKRASVRPTVRRAGSATSTGEASRVRPASTSASPA